MKKYFWMIFIGAIATLSYIFTIWTHCVYDTIINIIAMIGSGIFCSGIVSYIIESFEKRRIEELKCEQRDYILSSIKNSLLHLFSLEYKNLSEYLTLDDTTNKYKTVREKFKVENVMEKLCVWLEQISSNPTIHYQFANVIDSDYLKKFNRKNELAYQMLLPYYERLNSELLKIYEDSSIYIHEVFNKKQLEIIHNIQLDIDFIVAYSSENNIELLFEHKSIFVTNIKKVLDEFNIEQSEEIKCSYKSIDNNGERSKS